MVILKLTYVIILFLYCVQSSEVSENSNSKVQNSNRASKRYNYHHPPLMEEFYSIPVAVVFEKANRKNKSVDQSFNEMKLNNKSANQNISESSTKLNNSQNNYIKLLTKTANPVINSENNDGRQDLVSKTNDDLVKEPMTRKVKIDTKPASITEMELQIPVAVIYDPEPEAVLSHYENKSKGRLNKKENLANERLNIQPRAIKENATRDKANTTRKLRDKIQVPILRSENYVFSNSGDFHYSYEGGDGTKAFEKGALKSIDKNSGESVVGSFSYIGNDGNDYSLSYTADENGYRPVGAHLPTPPPIPLAIARALKYLATKMTPEPVTEAIK